MALSRGLRAAALGWANLLLPVAVLVFGSGFFPYKPVLPGLARFEDGDGKTADEAGGHHGGAQQQPAAVFDRVVFMVVDALRSDFVYGYGSGFEYTQSLIRTGAALPFTAHATPPTVTMPRIKALTTGSVPSFLDLLLNFAESDTSSSLAGQDTWLAQLRARGGQLAFYGDDTWLKLFPGEFFARAEGTSSFFVSDFTEVDYNVTRHVPSELARSDWDALVLHYLGLDHIGHKTGPQGPNMLPKQREMDGIVRITYEAMEGQSHLKNTLLVLAGDHGMNSGGNHGGSGPGETEPALVFVSPKMRDLEKEYECPTRPKDGTEFHFYTKVEQSDLVPTLAGLMGVPVARNSLGVFIEELGGFWKSEERRRLRYQNARQILGVVEAAYGVETFRSAVSSYGLERRHEREAPCEEESAGGQQLACLWAIISQHAGEQANTTEASSAYDAALTTFLYEAQEAMSGTASSYNLPRMVLGIALSATILLLSLLSLSTLWPPTPAAAFLTTATGLYSAMMFASSYVEEEQHFWYWLTPAWFLLLALTHISSSSTTTWRTPTALLTLLVIYRLAHRWHQTGQKFSGAPDIARFFAQHPQGHVSLWLLILITYTYLSWRLARRTFGGLLSPEISLLGGAVLVLPALIFKLNFTYADAPELVRGLGESVRERSAGWSLVAQARLAFAAIVVAGLVAGVLAVASHRAAIKQAASSSSGKLPSLAERLHGLLTLFLTIQTRAVDLPLFLAWEAQRFALRYLLLSRRDRSGRRVADAVEVATSTLLLSHTSFFSTGGSNSISSIDLGNAYNGVAGYNVAAVGGLLFASNWAGMIWWGGVASLLLHERSEGREALSRARTEKNADTTTRAWIATERASLRTTPSMDTPTSSDDDGGDGPGPYQLYISYTTAFTAASLLAVMLACTALRAHLFIWTVFSPKYLYAMAWAVGGHLGVNVGLGGLMGGLSSIR